MPPRNDQRQTFRVKIPDHLGPGDAFHVKIPSINQTISVKVPEGVKGGQTVELALPVQKAASPAAGGAQKPSSPTGTDIPPESPSKKKKSKKKKKGKKGKKKAEGA